MKKELVNMLKKAIEVAACFAITMIMVTLYDGIGYSEILDTCLEVYAYFAIGYTAMVFIKYVAKTLKDAFKSLERWAVSKN